MSKISLKHSGGNVVSLNSPTNAPTSADVAFKLPNADGTSGQVLKTDGSGNLSFVAQSGGIFSSYAIIRDQKSNTHGGTFTSGAWRTRDLNTEVVDADGIVSISSNQFTLQAGTYFIKAITPAYEAEHHQNRLYNVTDSSVVDTGSSEFTNPSSFVVTNSILLTRFTITGAKVFEVQHQANVSKSSTGFGVRSSEGFTTAADIYTTVEIYKEA